jgi:hypothetical protein
MHCGAIETRQTRRRSALRDVLDSKVHRPSDRDVVRAGLRRLTGAERPRAPSQDCEPGAVRVAAVRINLPDRVHKNAILSQVRRGGAGDSVLIAAVSIGILGVLVGLYRPVATLWPLLVVSITFIPIGYLLAGRSILSALAAGGICLLSTQGGFVVGLLGRWLLKKVRHRQAREIRAQQIRIDEKPIPDNEGRPVGRDES